jgi:ABC-2 type transport system permease protein
VTRLLAGELIKVRTTRTAYGFAIAGLMLVVATVLIVTLSGDPVTIRDKRSALAFGTVLSVLLLIYGVVGATGEFRHRTLAPAVLIAPDRSRLVTARMLAYGLTAGIAATIIGALMFLLGIPLLAGTSGPQLDSSDYLGLAAGGLLVSVLCAVLGVAYGTLIRNQVGAVVGLLVWIFVFEPLLPVIDEDLRRYTIGAAAGALGQGGDEDVSMLGAALALAAWTAVLGMAGVLVDRRRDVE